MKKKRKKLINLKLKSQRN